ncbi:Uncharacterised protein [Mycobacteroides abscessus subsp. abscessus]|nr:Uncharacterised protein [Mycobacteroides abscessus subsp. abscessus]
MQRARVLGVALGVEAVVDAAVDHGIEPRVPAVECGRVGHLEVDGYARGGRPALCLFYRRGRKIQAGDIKALLSEVNGIVAEATADVQDVAADRAQ